MSSKNAATSQRAPSAPPSSYAPTTAAANFAPAWCKIRKPGTSSISPFAILGITSLKIRAPWLPPKTSSRTTRDGPSLDEALSPRSPMAKNSRLTGIPVTRAPRKYLRVSSKFTAAAFTRLPTSRFASPGTAFGSKARVGTRSRIAAIIAGPEAYPPTPTTTSGLKSRTSPTQRITPSGRSTSVRNRVATLTFFNCPTRINSSGNPASGTSLVSSPRAVPTNRTSAPCASRSSRAIASAGMTCPPVPPPAIRTRNCVWLSIPYSLLPTPCSSIDLARDIQQHTHAGQRNKKRSSARRDERQRNSLGRQQRQHHAHVEESLNQNRRRNPKRKEPRKRVRRQRRRPQPAIPQRHKQSHNQQRSNQSQLFTDIGEDEVSLHLRQIKKLLPPFHQPQPAQPTGPNRDQRLKNMKPGPSRIGLRIDECKHTVPSELHKEQHVIEHRRRQRSANRKVLRSCPS